MTAQLDLATVLLLHKSSFLIGAFCFLYARWQSPRDEGLGILASGFLFLALASTLAGYGEQKLLPAHLWTLSSFTLGIGGYALFWIGVRRLSAGRRRSADWLALCVPVTGALIGLATHFHVVNTVRASVFNATAFLFLAASAFAIISDRSREPLPARAMLAAAMTVGANLCLAVVIGLVKPGIIPVTTTYAFFLSIICHFAIALFALVLVKERAEAELRRSADTDALTGAGNRRWFLAQLPKSNWHGDCLIVMDLDFFKRINDRYGHHTGDQVLMAFAELARKNLRKGDCFARLGGEEFGLYLPLTSEERAQAIAERLRRAVEELRIISRGEQVALTVSMGLAVANGQERSWEELFNSADAALYEAKRHGRNRITLSTSSTVTISKPIAPPLSRAG
ncbi:MULTISPECIES: GGDEF domain-containing protein [unclassified Ensifer]|uniref:GGDEF domain-containing protein n=1 Tax=unclassified Ensifer TaxID=2633371 RepID=UPI000812ED05|nr:MULTISPECIES: GGDEF domain-containing protein [unclassified Ensifer]OCP00983.1 diguanylate cyclase [Ensifer sp. LC11]OCP01557.1 diguanylate cyclase [Ensifer sp. LC13]OCP02105.1 diguanylate cyclase [Ensifer sp. LC14]OCP30063.1 diguanylate cyclase [Ensifer sp. LC499]